MSQIKTFIIIALLLTTVGAGGFGMRYYRLYKNAVKPHPPVASYSSGSAAAVPIIDSFVDATGRQHTVIGTPEAIGRRKAEAIVNSTFKPIIDSLTRALAIRPKDIEGFTAVQMSTVRDSVKFLSRTLDSQRRQTRRYQDQYLSLLVRDPLPEDTADKGSFDFAYNADLKTVDYSRKKRILGLRIGRRQYFTDISSSDPRMTIRGVDKFTMQRRVPPLGLRIQALAGYNITNNNFSAGLGLRLDVGDRLNGGYNYTFNIDQQRWVQSVYVKYDLLQFGR